MLELGSKFLISYFIGSIMGSMIMGRLRGGVDIRELGSGNAGGTNALRTQGIAFALGVVIIDIGKGALGAGVVPGLELPFIASDPEISRVWLTLSCAAASVIGHIWPVYHRFRGGKGAATLVGTLLILGPQLILPLLLVWAWMLVITGYVGLATMVSAVALPTWKAITQLPDQQMFRNVKTAHDDGGNIKPRASGALIIGDKATMYAAGDYADRGIEIVGDVDTLKVDYPRSPGHVEEWFIGMRDPSKQPMSNFANYGGPLTETILLGNLAVYKASVPNAEAHVKWDAENMVAVGDPYLSKIVRPPFRAGYSL